MGAKRVFTDEQELFIFDNYRGKSDKEMCDLLFDAFGQSFKPRQITWFKTSHNLHSFELFPTNIVEFIKVNRYGKRHQELTDEINEKFGTAYTKTQISNYLRDHKLPTGASRARPELYKEGETFIRKNGHAYIKTNGEIVRKDRYVVEKSGIKLGPKDMIRHVDGDPVNCDIDNLKVISDGYETVICGIAYVRVDGRLVRKDRLVLEQLGIFLTPGQYVKHLDGDATNCEPSNLCVISQRENMILNYNHWNTTNPQLNQCAIDTVRLQVTVSDAIRKKPR